MTLSNLLKEREMNPTHDETWRARVHLAAANRLAVYDDLEEGIDNHFTMRVPGQDDRYLVLPFGQHWSEARAMCWKAAAAWS